MGNYCKSLIHSDTFHVQHHISFGEKNITRIPKSDVSLAKTEVKQGKFVKFISRAKGYFRETSKSQTINPISPTPKVSLGIIQIKIR